ATKPEASPSVEPEPKSQPTPSPTFDKKLQAELVKMAEKQRDLLQEVVSQDQTKQSDREKLHKLYETDIRKLCQILKTNGWPTSATVDRIGLAATFYILKNGATFELQRDLLPVILAAV